MKDPNTAKKYGKAQEIRRSISMNKLNYENKLSQNANIHQYEERVGNSELGDVMFKKPISNRISRRGSGDSTEQGFHRSVTATDYDLEYLEEIELEKAFNVFDSLI